jgi:1-acyl-sn-glycerol-3-phosphate acyltransferase
MTSRFIRRAVALGIVLSTAVVRYWMIRVQGPLTLERRARWLQETSIRVLRSMGIQYEVQGEIPTQGLVVANHLSYLDIVILSAAMPCFFVAKSEIGDWLYFGKAARAGGTLFIDRSRRASAEKVGAAITARLKLRVPILFFPEGTSTDGTMLKFHSSLFEPAIREAAPVSPVAISYLLDDGRPERELCWFGNEPLAPHLVRTLKAAGCHARLRFGKARVYESRRAAADATFAEIADMRSGSALGAMRCGTLDT